MWGWRTLVVRNDAKLRLLNGNIHIERKGEALSLPIEDIDLVLLESLEGTISLPLLRALLDKDIGLVVLGYNTMPRGVLIPFHSDTNHSNLLFLQLQAKLPFKKQIWQRIIKQKIYNQAEVLRHLRINRYTELLEIQKSVKSGDSDNREAYASKIYFNALRYGFSRKDGNAINAALNYGYAIARAALARSFFATGFACALGIKHLSKTNPFNLVDDFMEPFRPFVDFVVFSNPPEDELTTEYKRYLTGLLRLECLILNRTFTISGATWKVAQSYVNALKKQDSRLIELPQIDEISFRDFE